MAQRIKKQFFKILPWSVIGIMVITLVIGVYTNLPINFAHAAAINAATKVDVAPGTQFTTFIGVPVYRLHVANTGDASDTITSLSPTPSGSVTDTLITLHFYNDANDNGFVDQGDTDLGASAAFASDNTIQAFDIADVIVPASGSASILITADGTGALLNTETFTLSFALGANILMTVAPIGGFPLTNANALTISTTVPSLTIADGANDPVAKFVKASATNVAVKQLAISAAAGTSDSIVSLAPTPTGTENDNTNITSVVFYIDSGLTPGQVDGSDVQLVSTPATYSANNTQTIFTFSSAVQVAASSTVNILIVYNLGAGVTNGNTLYTAISATGDVIAGSGTALTADTSTTSALITIDTQAPTGTVVLGTPVIYSGDLIQEVTVNYDEPMDGASTPTITFGGTAGIFTSNADGVWAAANQWTETFTHDGTAETVIGATADSSLATDVAGNVEGADVQGTFNVDTVAPSVVSVTPNTLLINDTLVGVGTFFVDIAYDENMAPGSTPISVTTPDIVASGTVTLNAGLSGWTSLTNYRIFYDVADVNEEQSIINVNVTAATDTIGNLQNVYNSGPTPVVVDTKNPTGTVVLGTPVIYSGDLIQEVTVNYDEPMDGASTPTITFGGTAGIFTSNADGVWAAANQWTETFTHDGTAETVIGATADSSAATDVAGNVEGADVQGTFNVDTQVPTGTVVLGTPVIYSGDLIQEVTVNYDEPMDGASTPTITFGGTAGIFTSNADGVWAAANQWTETFTHDGTAETVIGATADSSAATDVAGNVEGADVQGTFNVDTQVPTGTVVLGTPVIYSGDLIQEVTVNYDEPMDGASTPTITFGGTAGIFTSNADGVWAAANQWTETFTHDGTLETVIGATADSSLATDVAGNVEGADVQGTFNVDTQVPTGTVVLGTPVIYSGDLIQEVTVNYDEPMDGASTPTITFGGTAGIFTSNADGVWAAANQWTETFTHDGTLETVIGATADSSLATDVAGNVEGADVQGTFNVDTQVPTVASYSPVDGAINVPIAANLVLTINENVQVGTGNVVIYKTGGALVETIDITSGLVTFNGTTGVTINPTANLLNSTGYYVQIAATAIEDLAGNAYVGIADTTTWDFTTVAASSYGGGGGGGSTTPTVVSSSNVPLTVLPSQSGTLTQGFADGSQVIINIPQNSVANSTTFGVTQGSLTSNNTPLATTGAIMIGNQIFNISATSNGTAVTSFNSNLSITITVPSLPDSTTDLGVYYFDSANNQWVLVPGVVFDPVTNKVTFTVNHLTQFAVFKVSGLPSTIAVSATAVTPPTPESPLPAAPVAQLIHDPSSLAELLAGLSLVRNTAEEAKYLPLVTADALAFKVNLSAAQRDAIVNFIVYGISNATIKLGSGERRALMRDYMETVARPDVVWTDIELIATGQKPIKRNLANEQAQVGRVLATFITLVGHTPNFKNASEDLAWNTMMYRIRFTRDLAKEKIGILKFIENFGKNPTTPLAWSTVRAWGYILK